MTTTAQPQPGPTSAADEAILCIRCEYNLRGLPREGKCPECGEAIELSWKRYEIKRALGYTPLHKAPPVFLRRMGWSCIIYASAAMAYGIMAMTARLPRRVEVAWVLQIVAIVIFVLMPWSVWLMGMRESRESETRWSRILIHITVLWWALELPWRFRGTIYPANLAIYLPLYVSVAGIGTWAAWQRFARLFRRAGRRGFARWAIALSWTLPALFATQICKSSIIWLVRWAYISVHVTPILGDGYAPFAIFYSILQWPRFDLSVCLWILVASLTILTLATLLEIAHVCLVAARRGRIHEPSK